ncbi:MAG: AAA family ATPase [Gammaproteobacteria bacterium]|nr:AAA family ATPase [Gammaproteobacteria bacterium]
MKTKSDPDTLDTQLEYGHRLLVDWASSITRGMRYPSEATRELLEEATAGDSFADLRTAESTAPMLDFLPGSGEESWHRFREALGRLQEIISKIPPSLPARRIGELGRIFELDDGDIRILEVLLFSMFPGPAEAFLGFLLDGLVRGGSRTRHCSRRLNADNRYLHRLLGMSRMELRKRLDPKSCLGRKGLVEVDEDLDIEVPDTLRRLYLDMDEQADVRSLLLGQGALTTDLEWSDFAHLGQDQEDLAAVLQGAMAGERLSGVNVLLYGPPGMGKTSLARVAARHAGIRLLDVGETDGQGGDPSARERLRELRLAQNLLEGDNRSALLLDEMDDVLDGGQMSFPWLFGPQRLTGKNGSSRVWLHRLLENTPVPTIWIANDASTIDRAVLRRMTYALELRLPPTRVRASIWSRQLARHGVEAGEAEARSLAEGFEASPGVADGAIRAGRLGGGDIDLVRRSVDRLSRLMGCGRPGIQGEVDFDPALIHADLDPVELAKRLASGNERRFSMCLQGPPGTGKSAYVRYLADQLGMEVLFRRASDLMNMFVGGTEQRIARAFEMARDAGAFLVFDEADSLLGERRNTRYSWEVSQVNEMLTWMESHPLPFACTTNFGSSLDMATARRFLFKITLDFLDRDQSRLAFHRWFGREAPLTLDRVNELTPGDFEVVRRKARVMGQMDDGEELVELLRAEVLARPGHRRAPAGFLSHGGTSQ